ncbi:MAG: NADH:ubiquinone reductase (Na(+)-transporting) subunit A, partial [Bacteroidales bacterium]
DRAVRALHAQGAAQDHRDRRREDRDRVGQKAERHRDEQAGQISVDADNTRSGAFLEAKGVQLHHFKGPHPAGNVGVQIHHIDPINKGEVVWQVSVQNVILIGRLFEHGIYDPRKIIALAGSEIAEPSYYKVISGASVASFTEGKLRPEQDLPPRYISGDPLTGIKISDKGFLGYYHDQVTVLPEGIRPQAFGWLSLNLNRFSVSRTFFSYLMPRKKFRHDTNIRSGERPFVLTGVYDSVLPMDILPVQLIKSIMINDIDKMEQLGIYEVAPEDFALVEYVCPSKIEMQTIIRQGLDVMVKEFA